MHSKILHGIDTVIVRVADYSFSKKWYEEKLELTPVWDDPILKLAVMDTGSPTSITLWQTDSKIEVNRKTASYPIFRILSAVEAHSALQKRGVQVSDIITDHAVTYFTFFDPDGNVLEACQVHS
ncbi:MAG: VOC family protein [Cyclobacteriaceae bacterium]|nr:VOC family protein [Cyclobacteriaceae bacterium]